MLPVCPILESSQPQLSKSPILQFLVSVYITPAALMAWTKDVSLVATIGDKQKKKQNHNVKRYESIWHHKCAQMLCVEGA